MKLLLVLISLLSFLKFTNSQSINITQPSQNTSWNFCSALTICWTCIPGGSVWLLNLVEKGSGDATAYESVSISCDDGAGSYTWFLNQTLVTGSYSLSVSYVTSIAYVDINIVGAKSATCNAPSSIPSGACSITTRYSAPTSTAVTSTATASQGACTNCGTNMAAIIGGTAGGIVLIVSVVAIICCCHRHKRNGRKAVMETELPTMTSRSTDAVEKSDKSKKSDLDRNGVVNLDGSRKGTDRTDILQSNKTSRA